MTTFILPCGTSLLDNLAWGRGWAHPEPGLVDGLERWAAGPPPINERAPRQWAGQVAERLADLPNGYDRLVVSAESSSMWRHPTPAGSADHVVFLASDTPRGVLAALANGYLLGGSVTFRVGAPPFGAEQAPVINSAHGPASDVILVGGLYPDDTARFTEAMREVGRSLKWALPANGADVVLLLTGGYKATIPYLAVLAECAKAWGSHITAFCLYEGEPSKPPPGLIQIFLRQVDLEADGEEIDAALQGKLEPTEGRLRGFAYLRRAGAARDELTPLGAAIYAFIRG